MTFETLLDLSKSLLGNANAVCIHFVEPWNDGANGFPGHGARPGHDRVDGLSIPFPGMGSPSGVQWGGTMVRRIRDQHDFQHCRQQLHHPCMHGGLSLPAVGRGQGDHPWAHVPIMMLAQMAPLLEAIREKVTRVPRGAEDDGSQAAEHLQDTTGNQLFLGPHVMIPGLDGLAAARLPTAGQRSYVQCGLGISGNPQGIRGRPRRDSPSGHGRKSPRFRAHA